MITYERSDFRNDGHEGENRRSHLASVTERRTHDRHAITLWTRTYKHIDT